MRKSIIYSALLFSILCISTSSIITRFCSAPPLIIAFYRLLFTAGMAAIPAWLFSRGQIAVLKSKNYLYMLGAGIFLALHFAFWISSLSYTSISSSVLFTNLQVIFVFIFSYLVLKEGINKWARVGIFTALLGSLLIAGNDFFNGNLYGDVLALVSGLFVAIYFLIGRRQRTVIPIWIYTFIVSLFAALVLFLTICFTGYSLIGVSPYEWWLFLALALGPGMAGHGVLNWALKYLKAPIVSVSVLGESVGASILAGVVFSEWLDIYQIAGGILILTGIGVAAANESR